MEIVYAIILQEGVCLFVVVVVILLLIFLSYFMHSNIARITVSDSIQYLPTYGYKISLSNFHPSGCMLVVKHF